jgi:hypothetical protein
VIARLAASAFAFLAALALVLLGQQAVSVLASADSTLPVVSISSETDDEEQKVLSTGLKVGSLTLEAMCSPNPAGYRVWQIKNPASTKVPFTWLLAFSSQSGSGLARAASNGQPGLTYFYTVTQNGQPNLVGLYSNGVLESVEPDPSAQCPPGSPPSPTAWDVNGDGIVDVNDVVAVGEHWQEHGAPAWIPEDVLPDGIIDINDVVEIGKHWQQ